MNQIFFYVAIALFATTACTHKDEAKTETGSETTASVKADLPYTLKKPYKDWQIGSQENVATLMKMIKAWETKNADECATYFADTVEMALDKFHQNMPHDSIASFLKSGYTDDYANIRIEMQDYESVISADKSEEWVTVWYKQVWTNSKGVADSSNMINDAKIVNGKIAAFDEYTQHFPAVKK